MPDDPQNDDLNSIDPHIERISSDLALSGRAAAEADVMAANREVGKEISAFAEAAAETVEGCPEPFRNLSCTPRSLRDKSARLRRVLRNKDKIDRLSRKMSDEAGCLRVELHRDINDVLQASDATLLHPGSDPLKERLDNAAQPLFALREGRRANITAARASTKALKERVGGDAEEKDERIATLESENAELVLETRFLAGEQLRPADLRAPATAPAAARAARRAAARRTPR